MPFASRLCAGLGLCALAAHSHARFPSAVIQVSGTVFDDRNGNGQKEPTEPGLGGVSVSDQDQVVTTGPDGTFRLTSAGTSGVLFVSLPDGFRADSWWRPMTADQRSADFPLRQAPHAAEFTFIHASDTHVSGATRSRMQRLRAMVDSIHPAFVIITGDLVKDALRVSETEATGYYRIFQDEASQLAATLWSVPGNHENFGIERTLSGVSRDHPLYARGMYHAFRGPDYYSFNAGGIHFVGLNTIDIDDMWYYGHVDSAQVAWLARDLANVPSQTPVVTFNHIPFFTAVETINGYTDAPPAPSVITVNGKSSFRHSVSNARAILAVIRGHPYPLALGGHMHVREILRYPGIETRFDQSAAIVGNSGSTELTFPSGITVYHVRAGRIGEGEFVPLGIK